MRTKAVLSCLLAAMMFLTTVPVVSPLRIDARAGEEHASAQSIEAHLHHTGHEHAPAPHGKDTGHEHQDDAPVSPCTSICCAAGMACCAALIAAPFDMRLPNERIRLQAPFGDVRAGIEPAVPLRPPRAAA